MGLGHNKRKLLITPSSWATSSFLHGYLHQNKQNVKYKVGEVVQVAIMLSTGTSENVGYIKIEEIVGQLTKIKLVEFAPSLRVTRVSNKRRNNDEL